MAELIAQNPVLKFALLLALFVLVAAVSYAGAGIVEARRLARKRLLSDGVATEEFPLLATSLRSDHASTAWLRLVNNVEKAGLSLADTKDEALRRRLASAGFSASYAP